jgi:hypothetical protein
VGTFNDLANPNTLAVVLANDSAISMILGELDAAARRSAAGEFELTPVVSATYE